VLLNSRLESNKEEEKGSWYVRWPIVWRNEVWNFFFFFITLKPRVG